MTEPHRQSPVVVHRWVQMVLLPMALLAGYALLRAAAPVIGIFVFAGVIALILTPLVTFVHRGPVPRGLAVAVVYLGFLLVVATAGYLLANPIANQAQSFGEDVPGIVDDANRNLADVQDYFDRKGIDVEIKKQGQTALETLRDKVVGGTENVVSAGTQVLESTVRAGLTLILVFVLSIYMLLYGQRIGDLARRLMPPGDGTPEDDYPTRVQHAVAGYVRGQFLFSLAMGSGAAASLYVFGLLGIFPAGKTYALAFGIFFGLMELIPFVGPFLGALPPVLVALLTDPLTAIWVGLLFVALQQIEGHIVAPQIFGHALRINPLLVIFSLLLGAELYGFIGALIALPIAAILRETWDYLAEHVVLAPWGDPIPEPVDEAAEPPRPRASRR
jgi:predicted PurR-regulated permease PerM